MRFLAIGFALALIPAASHAQQSANTRQSANVASKGPTIQSASVGFRVKDTKVDASTKVNTAPSRPRAGQDVALMVVGVGAMIVGALVDDAAGTIIIIGGAAMALFGLYHYLE